MRSRYQCRNYKRIIKKKYPNTKYSGGLMDLLFLKLVQRKALGKHFFFKFTLVNRRTKTMHKKLPRYARHSFQFGSAALQSSTRLNFTPELQLWTRPVSCSKIRFQSRHEIAPPGVNLISTQKVPSNSVPARGERVDEFLKRNPNQHNPNTVLETQPE